MPDLTDSDLDQLITDIGLRPRRGPGARAACGTPGGYYRHLRKDCDAPCDACRAARNADSARHYAAEPKRPEALPPIKHGTPAGARQHWYRKVPVCDACRAAFNEAQNSRKRAARRAGAR